jgi:hypothetical protein
MMQSYVVADDAGKLLASDRTQFVRLKNIKPLKISQFWVLGIYIYWSDRVLKVAALSLGKCFRSERRISEWA